MNDPPYSVGLAGDGDEIAAIDEVERAFEVRLDYADAANWHTAGDVFASLNKVLPLEEQASRRWSRFTAALAGQTGIDPELITLESPMLLPTSNFWRRVNDASARIWLASAIVILSLLALSVM